MLKVWKVSGNVEYGWCTVVVSATNAKHAVNIAKGAEYASECVSTWYPAKHIQGVFDHTNIPRILAQEIGQE